MTRSAPHSWHGTPDPQRPTIVVGVMPGQAAAVVRAAASIAAAMSASMVCVWSDAGRSLVARQVDGALVTTPLDPDRLDAGDDVPADEALHEELAAELADHDGPWLLVYTVGEVARSLVEASREHSASMIVVGTHRPGLAGWMNHAIGGSVAGHLSHTQHLPVTIIPQDPQAVG